MCVCDFFLSLFVLKSFPILLTKLDRTEVFTEAKSILPNKPMFAEPSKTFQLSDLSFLRTKHFILGKMMSD